MIVDLELRCFRKHKDLKLSLVQGLNVIRGPNEIGKTTITEGILYALYGANVLRDTLAETVTWGHKESELSARLVIRVRNTDYTFTRAKSGAEVNYTDPAGKELKVTGQKEVSAFAAEILGADAKTGSLLMLASQSGLRGALDDGATAVSGLMAKLADFDLLDQILDAAQKKLLLGADGPLREKLTAAEAEVAQAEAAIPGAAAIEEIDRRAATMRDGLAVVETLIAEQYQPAMVAADQKVQDDKERQAAHERATQYLADVQGKLAAERTKLGVAEADAAKKADPARIDTLRRQIGDAQGHERLLASHALLAGLPAYPKSFWEGDKGSFDAEMQAATKKRDEALARVREIAGETKALGRSLQSVLSGKCPTCGQDVKGDEHVLKHNAETQSRIAALETEAAAKNVIATDAQDDINALADVDTAAKPFVAAAQRLGDLVDVDLGFYPPKLSWRGAVPQRSSQTSAQMQAELKLLEGQNLAAAQAEGRVTAHRQAIHGLETDLVAAQKAVELSPPADIEPSIEAYEAAYRTYTEASEQLRNVRAEIQSLEMQKTMALGAAEAARVRVETVKQRVEEYRTDLKTLAFNNQLVKKLRGLKPIITDYLWNTVLAAVSNFFSTLRGETSVVTKDGDGFKVNGRGTSGLSGSTLDCLALAIRVALSKTFVPHASFMMLDEPAHGCDDNRTGNVLGFLASVGFDQIILASHDELSESVADKVIQLGE